MESVPNLTKSKSDISATLANTKYHEITDTYMVYKATLAQGILGFDLFEKTFFQF